MSTTIGFARLGDGIYTARTSPLDVNTSLIVGDDAALVIDTLSTPAQARRLLDAVRALTDRPVWVLNTHAHFDHCFGNAVLAPDGPIWAHEAAAADLREHGPARQREAVAEAGDAGLAADFAAGIAEATIKIPDHVVRAPQVLDLGGRTVTIEHFGRGHTDGDVVAFAEGVVFTGDLAESGAPPSFGPDSYPLLWPETLAAMLHAAKTTAGAVFVPGHGAVMSSDEVAAQHADLARFAWLIREAHGDGATVEATAGAAPWPAEAARSGVKRGFAALDDPLD